MPNLDIIINATDQASGVIRTVSGSVGALGDKAAGVASKGFSGLQSAMGMGLKVAAGIGGAAFAGLGLALKDGIAQARESIAIEKQLAAVLESTGGIAGVTADSAKELASSLQGLTNFEDDAILGGENMLLTFTNIGSDIFPQATEAMLNMSQAMGQDLKSSAIQLGKALNDPTEGMSALSRSGIQFTEAQKEQIETMQEAGDVAGAQAVILAELERQFGGSAQAAADPLTQLRNAFGNLKETIGVAIIPIFNDLAQRAMPLIQSGMGFITTAVTEFKKGIEGGGTAISGIVEILDDFLPEATIDRIWRFLDGFEFFREKVQEFMAPIAAFVAENVKLSDVMIVLGGVLASIIIPAIAGMLPVIAVVAALMAGVVLLRNAWESNFGGIQEKTGEAMEKIRAIIAKVLELVKGIWQGHGDETGGIVQGFLTYLTDVFTFALDTILSILDIALAILSGDWEAAWAGVVSIAEGAWVLLKSAWTNVLSSIWELIKSIDWLALGRSIVEGIGAGISAGASLIWDALMGAVSGAWQGAKDFLGIHSPSTLFADLGRQTMAGFAGGITANAYQPAMAAIGAAGNTYASTYNMTFNGQGNPSDTAYAVQDAILRTQRRRGY